MPAPTDVVPFVESPAGTPVTKKVEVRDLVGVCVPATGEGVTSTSLVNLAGLSIALTPGTYIFEAMLYANSSSTAGGRFGVQFSGTATVDAVFEGQTSTTGIAATARITALNSASTIIGTTASAETANRITGKLVVTASGNLTIQGLKVTSGTLTVRASSWLRVFRVAA